MAQLIRILGNIFKIFSVDTVPFLKVKEANNWIGLPFHVKLREIKPTAYLSYRKSQEKIHGSEAKTQPPQRWSHDWSPSWCENVRLKRKSFVAELFCKDTGKRGRILEGNHIYIQILTINYWFKCYVVLAQWKDWFRFTHVNESIRIRAFRKINIKRLG